MQQTNILDTEMYIREARSWTVLDMIFLIWFAEFGMEEPLDVSTLK